MDEGRSCTTDSFCIIKYQELYICIEFVHNLNKTCKYNLFDVTLKSAMCDTSA